MIPFDYLSLGEIVHRSIEILIHCAFFGGVLTLLLWLVNRPAFVSSARHRYRLWTVGLAVVVALPLLFVVGQSIGSANAGQNKVVLAENQAGARPSEVPPPSIVVGSPQRPVTLIQTTLQLAARSARYRHCRG